MKKFTVLLFAVVSVALSYGQIVSTSSGGYWRDASTWVGGIVPVDTNDVVIDGNIILDGYGHACHNLTVNSGDTLYNISTSSNNLKVYGNILNNGVVLVKASYTLYPYGDIVNNGTWDTYYTQLEYGTIDELIEINGLFTFTLFRINANVNGASSYQWYKDGQAISEATGSRYYLHADEDYVGEYYCHTDAGDSRKITINKGNSNGGVLLTEHFDGETFPPAGWTQTIQVSDKTWGNGNPQNNSFTDIDPTNVYSALCPYVDQDQDEWLKSPSVDLPDGNATLEFYAGYSTGWLANATLKLNISTDGGTNWTKIWEAENDGKDWSWRKVSVDLSSYTGQTVILAWQYIGNNGDLVAIDNVVITQGITGIGRKEAEMDQMLLQNYPNPFSSQTYISFRLKNKSDVRLVIYNSVGQQIAQPVMGNLLAGNHKIMFNAKGLKPGVYYYQLVLNGAAVTKRMILLK